MNTLIVSHGYAMISTFEDARAVVQATGALIVVSNDKDDKDDKDDKVLATYAPGFYANAHIAQTLEDLRNISARLNEDMQRGMKERLELAAARAEDKTATSDRPA